MKTCFVPLLSSSYFTSFPGDGDSFQSLFRAHQAIQYLFASSASFEDIAFKIRERVASSTVFRMVMVLAGLILYVCISSSAALAGVIPAKV